MSKNILITGASGFLGLALYRQLIVQGHRVSVMGRSPEQLISLFVDIEKSRVYSSDKLADVPFEQFDYIVHGAFARASVGHELASSLQLQRLIINHVISRQSNASFINISSQAVYGMTTPPLWSEKTPPNPDYLYAMAKFSGELLCDEFARSGNYYTSLRLPGITGAYEGLKPEVSSRFVSNALLGKPIDIVGGTQVFSNIDLGDVVDGICVLINNTMAEDWATVYNLGNIRPYSIVEIAETVRAVAPEFVTKKVVINIIEQEEKVKVNAGLDSTKFYQFASWKPQRDLTDTVRELFKFLQEKPF